MKLAILMCLLVLASPVSGWVQDPDPQKPAEEEQAPEGQAPETATPEEKPPEERAPKKEEEAESRRVYWDDGLWIENLFGDGRLKIGGQVQNDTAGFVSDGTQPVEIENGVEWRRARVYALGTIGERWAYKFQWDLADRPYLKDAWLQLKFQIFDGKVWLRGGRFSTTFGLENDGRSGDLLFMEQGLPAAFVPPQETGVLLHSESTNRRWDISFSSSADDLECLLCSVVGIAGRYSTHFDFEGKEKLLHVGVNYSRRWTSDDSVVYSQRPESHIAPYFVDTGSILARWVDTGLFEAAFINGPFSVQTEVVVAGVKPSEGPRPVFSGYYVSGAYTLTGESRPYRRRLGLIGGISPARSWREGGRGAFEIALRYSRIDLNSQDVTGGALRDSSFALNWYPTAHIKLSFNTIRAARQDWDPVWVFQARLQVMY